MNCLQNYQMGIITILMVMATIFLLKQSKTKTKSTWYSLTLILTLLPIYWIKNYFIKRRILRKYIFGLGLSLTRSFTLKKIGSVRLFKLVILPFEEAPVFLSLYSLLSSILSANLVSESCSAISLVVLLKLIFKLTQNSI